MGGNAEDAMKSVSYFDKAIELDPKNPLPYLNKGLAVLYVQHNVLGAIELLEKALEVDPKNIQALTHIGQVKCSIASNVDEAEDASKIFDKAIEMTKDTNELHELCSLKVMKKFSLPISSSSMWVWCMSCHLIMTLNLGLTEPLFLIARSLLKHECERLVV